MRRAASARKKFKYMQLLPLCNYLPLLKKKQKMGFGGGKSAKIEIFGGQKMKIQLRIGSTNLFKKCWRDIFSSISPTHCNKRMIAEFMAVVSDLIPVQEPKTRLGRTFLGLANRNVRMDDAVHFKEKCAALCA